MKRRNPVFLVAVLMPLFVISFILWAFQPDIAYAATWVVSITTDENDGSCIDGDCSLRDAIQVAVSGDDITIPAGTYTLTLGQLAVANKNLTFNGSGSGSTILDGNAANRIFSISGAANSIGLNGITIRNGTTIATQDGAGVFIASGTVSLSDVVVEANISGRNGGGIYITTGSLTLANSIIRNNTAALSGGGVYNRNATVTLQSGQIRLNTAVSGAGVYINQATASFIQQGGSIEDNTASGDQAGAGVFVNIGTFTMNGGDIQNNIATAPSGNDPFPGGGVYIGTGFAILNGGTIHDNTAYRGAGVLVNSGSLTLDGAQILSNTATYGGGVYVFQTAATFTLITGTLAYNTANPAIFDFGGGGVYIFNGTLTMQGGFIRNNNTNYNGGGVNVAQGDLIVTGGEIRDNTANNSGGAFYSRNAAAVSTIDNATITGNSPNAFGIGDGSVLARGNIISNHTTVFHQTGGTFTAYANNIDTFTTGVNTTAGTFNGRHNWWGAVSPTGVNHTDSVNYRLGASVQSWGVGTLGDAAISGGTGTAVIVSHGRTNVPFAIPPTPAGTPCSDFYDFFTAPGASGTWTVDIPVDSSIACDFTFTNLKLFHFLLDGSNAPDPTCAQPTDCWLLYGAVSSIAGPPRLLRVSLTTAELGGTPIVVGDQSGEDPTAVTLTHLATGFTSGMAGVGLAAGILGLITAVFLLRRATTKFRFDRA